MQDIWYADKRDLVKWSVLIKLAEINDVDKILQIAYYRKSKFKETEIYIDGKSHQIPDEVVNHFRIIRRIQNIRELKTDIEICIFDELFENRQEYHDKVVRLLADQKNKKCIVFLDPDTGLQPPKSRPGYQHVLNDEVKRIWDEMKNDDILVFYQHGNLSGQPWKEPKRMQLANAIGVDDNLVKVANGDRIAHDVVFYFLFKSD